MIASRSVVRLAAAWTSRFGRVVRRPDVALPAALWLGLVLWGRLVFGLRFIIPWANLQILDRRDLFEHPWLSLLYLHAQPPLMNALLALHLQIERNLGIAAVASLSCSFTLIGLVASIAIYQVLCSVTRDRRVAIVGFVALLVDPAQLYYWSVGFYPFLVYAACTALVWGANRYLRRGGAGPLAVTAAGAAAMTLSQTMFHPLWALATVGVTMLLRVGLRAPRLKVSRRELILLPTIVLLLGAWPAKNWLVFRQFIYSSWTGYNLARTTPEHSAILDQFDRTGMVADDRVWDYPLPHWVGPIGREMLTRPRKGPSSDNAVNWNHLIFLVENRDLTTRARTWRRQHVRLWLQSHMSFFYACFTHAPIVHPYTRRVLGPPHPAWRAWARFHTRLFYPDIYPLLARVPGWPDPDPKREADALYSYWLSFTLFGLITFPVVMGWGISRLRRAGHANDPGAQLALLATSVVLWQLLVSLLTDGGEGMRYRFSTLPAFAILATGLVDAVVVRLGSKLRSRVAATSPEFP